MGFGSTLVRSMELKCNPEVAAHLHSPLQRTRLITEDGFSRFGYCLRCKSNKLTQTTAGTVAQDFFCPKCGQPYELKSAAKAHTRIVQDGGYDSMMRSVRSENAPALMLMHYSPQWCVLGLVAIHPVFLTPAVVMKRKKPHIRPRTGQEYWMCDLNLSFIPADGKIALVSDGIVRPHAEARRQFRESVRFEDVPVAKRGWAALVLSVVRKIGKTHITNDDLYSHEKTMHAAYPDNSHIQDKIRQQMQVLIRLGYVERIARGEYQVIR